MFSGKLWKFDDIESIALTPASIGTDSRRSFCSHQLKWGRSLFKTKKCRRISKKFSSENLTKPTMLHVVVERWLHIENSLAFRFERFICVERKLPPLSYLTYLAARKRFRQNDYMRLQIHKDIDAVLMLKKFGKFFTNLCIDFEHSFFDGFVASSRGGNWSLLRNGPDFDSMMRDCTSLKRLKFRKVDFKSFSIWKCRNILRNIETLEIEDCIGITQKIAHLLNVCKKMKHFTLGPTYHLQEPSDLFSSIVGFGQDVETIRLKIDSTYETALFLIFLKRLQRNKNLKTLELGLFWEYSMSTRVINALTTIDSLEELNLRRFIPNEDYFRALNRCKNLKVCKLHTNESVTDAMMGLASNFAFTSEKNESERCDEDLDYMETTPCPTIYTIVLIRKGWKRMIITIHNRHR